MPTLDFTIVLSAKTDGPGYLLEVTESPAGLPAAPCDLSLAPEEILQETFRHLAALSPAEPKDRQVRGKNIAAPFDPTQIGDLGRQLGRPLFERLFVGDLARAFTSAWTAVQMRRAGGEDCNLRLRLQFGRPSEKAPWDNPELVRSLSALAPLPWEYILHPTEGDFLALRGFLSIVRRIDTRRLTDFPPVTPPIRVLLAACEPNDTDPLDLKTEMSAITKALSASFEVLPLINPDLETVDRTMREWKPNIFHFMGHGGFWKENGEGHLCFVGRDGNAERKRAHEIAEVFREHLTLRLVVLNACRGAQIENRVAASPFLATATALLAAGLPAVLAMQFSISDEAAIAFSRAFYTELPSLESIETAVWMGRRAIKGVSAEFGTPVLYLQSQDGQLFAKPAPAARRDDEPRHVRLAIQSFEGFGQELAKSCDSVLDLTGYFEGRRIRQPESWNDVLLRRLVRFLSREVKEELPLDLAVSAHQSLAFTLGYLLEAKAGIVPSFYQRGQASGSPVWHKDQGLVPSGVLWRSIEPIARNGEAGDLALAISVAQPTRRAVEEYLDSEGPRVNTLYHAEVPDVGPDSVANGAHAFQLAKALHTEIYGGAKGLRTGTLHLFGAAPNAFFFFLGQMAVPWGRIQLYEFNFRGEAGQGTYLPSILLDPATLPRRGSREGLQFLFT